MDANVRTVGSRRQRSVRPIDASLHSGRLRVRIAIKPDAPPGRFKDTVTVRTNSTRQPTLTIPVVGVVDAAASGQAAEPPE